MSGTTPRYDYENSYFCPIFEHLKAKTHVLRLEMHVLRLKMHILRLKTEHFNFKK